MKKSTKIFCQHPFELENDKRIRRLDRVYPDSGFGVFYKVRNRICLGGGAYALSGIISEIAGNSKKRMKRLLSVLRDFDLFVIENGMVSLAQGLTVSELHPRQERQVSNKDRLKQVQQKINEGYDDSLMPDDLRRMDEEALLRIQDNVREENDKQLIDFI